ncbi:vWA domain-containing protein [Hydrogenimonas sp.]
MNTSYSNAIDDYILAQEELFENPDPRLPVCLVLDVSGSMTGAPIAELQRGVETFFESVLSDDVARGSAEVAIVTFGGEVAAPLDFRAVENQRIPVLEAGGMTPMGQAVETALGMLEARKSEYRNAGVDYYQPWMVLMTDGIPTDDISDASRRISELAESRKITVFPIAIGDADTEVLERLGGGRKPLRLQGLRFAEFFTWLSRSVAKVSQSIPGERVELPEGLESWAAL